MGSARSDASIVVSDSFFACVYHSTRAGVTTRDAILERERLDEVLLAEVQVHRALVHGRVCAVALDEPEERAGLAVDHRERLGVSRAQRDARGRIVAPLPDVAGARLLELRQLRGAAERFGAERLRVAVVERRLERGGEDVRVEDARVRVVEDRRLDPAGEQRVGLAREELVERVVARDEDREPAPAPARPSPLLAERRDRAREADGDRAVEEADVDPELERVRRGHSEQVALDQPRSISRRCSGV